VRLLPLLWYLVFFTGPLLLVLVMGFLTRGAYGGILWQIHLENFIRIFDFIYLGIFGRSLVLSLLTSALCAVIGFPFAWMLSSAPPRKRNFLLFLFALPFLTNLVIRIYALKLFLGQDGPVNWLLLLLKIPFDPYALTSNMALVLFGMVTTYLPFMIFPLYAALNKFDDSLIQAAQDLGANWRQIIFKVIFPLLRAPLTAGFLMVFIPAMGEFVIPDLLGGAKVMLIGNLITEQFLKARDWPFGSALTLVLICIIAGFALSLNREESHD
jgi:spermidine/putrescine transport system permease protein